VSLSLSINTAHYITTKQRFFRKAWTSLLYITYLLPVLKAGATIKTLKAVYSHASI